MVNVDSISDLLCNIKESMKPYFNTKTEITGLLAGKADSGHNHDDAYYAKGTVDDKISSAVSSHNHDSRYYTQGYLNEELGKKAPSIHDHDTQYYSISVMNGKLDLKADSIHSHDPASAVKAGFMSQDMFNKLDAIQPEANKTVVDSRLNSTSTNPVQNKVLNTELNKKASLDVANATNKGLMSSTMVNKLNSITEGATAKKRTPGLYIASPKDTGNGGMIRIDQGTKLRVCLYNPEILSSFASTGWNETALISGTDVHYMINGINSSISSGGSFTINLSPAIYDINFIFHGSGNYYPIYRTVKVKVD